jgi:hypothetical protein
MVVGQLGTNDPIIVAGVGVRIPEEIIHQQNKKTNSGKLAKYYPALGNVKTYTHARH